MISRRTAIGALAAVTGGTMGASSARGGDAPAPAGAAAVPTYKFRMLKAKARVYEGGNIREHRIHDFPESHNMSAGVITLETGAFREPHWHPNSDEWAYILEGKVQLTVVGAHGQTTVEEFEYGDAWFVPIGFGHVVVNLGDSPAQVLVVHNHSDFSTVELSEWVAGGPKDVFATSLNVPEQTLDRVPKKKLFLAKKKKS